jgi:hypothetical protein
MRFDPRYVDELMRDAPNDDSENLTLASPD